jgi:riboflavin kinase/FMN adenylyltransferase
LILAAGVFDGVHLGHQAVMRKAREEAEVKGALPGVLTFRPHPAKVLAPARCPASLAIPSQKRDLVAAQGMDIMIELEFTEAFAKLGATEFLELLCKALPGGLKGICAGASWSFGANRSGSMEFLKNVGPAMGFEVWEVPAVNVAGQIVSSTRIRRAVAEGRLTDAAGCLGRPFSIRGTVQQGARLGRELGFPTANISLADQQLPPNGVYAGRAILNGVSFAAAVNLGCRPTVDKDRTHQVLEAHILAFNGDLYGTEMEVELHEFLRPERKFSGPEDLRTQIASDVARVELLEKRSLSRLPNPGKCP